MNQCPSTFYGAQCGGVINHVGNHAAYHTSGHITVWTDTAADTKEPAS